MSVLILCGVDSLAEGLGHKKCVEESCSTKHVSDSLCVRLLDSLKSVSDEINLCNSVSQLVANLRMPITSPSAIVLVIDCWNMLEELIGIHDLFDGIPVILVQTYEDPKTNQCIHSLYPRYISQGEGDLRDVAGVISNLMAR